MFTDIHADTYTCDRVRGALWRSQSFGSEILNCLLSREGGDPVSGIDGRVPALGYVIPFDVRGAPYRG